MRKEFVSILIGVMVGAVYAIVFRNSGEWVRFNAWPETVRIVMLLGSPLSFGLGGLIYGRWPSAHPNAIVADYAKWMLVLAVAFGCSSLVEALYSSRLEVFVVATVMGSAAGLSIAAGSRFLRKEMLAGK